MSVDYPRRLQAQQHEALRVHAQPFVRQARLLGARSEDTRRPFEQALEQG